ncbi:MAG: hypothetical protein VB877_13195 [Pirellulaceae bacterium]
MPIESYDACPCGSGEKIKFCCGAVIVDELESISRAMEGSQFAAAQQQIDKLVESKGSLACLLAMKGITLLATSQLDAARKNADLFRETAPENMSAWAQTALIQAAEDASQAMQSLQRALELTNVEQSAQILDAAIKAVTDALFQSGQLTAGYWHLTLQSSFAVTEEDQQTAQGRFVQIAQNRNLPLLLKQQLRFPEPAEDVSWYEPFQSIIKLANRGAWNAALQQVATLLEKHPQEHDLLRARACLLTYLGDSAEGPDAWRGYARTFQEESDDAIEAEAYAQLLDQQNQPDQIELATTVFPVDNLEILQEQLLSNRLLKSAPQPPDDSFSSDEPPPKSVFLLLNGELPESGEGLTMAQVPQAIASLVLFGKQTDRAARVECYPVKADNGASLAEITEALGDLVGTPETKEEKRVVGKLANAVAWHPMFPEDTSPELRAQLSREHRQQALLETWPTLSLKMFGDITASEAAADMDGRLKVLAAIMLLEIDIQNNEPEFSLDDLREKLSLPRSEMLSVDGLDLGQVSEVQLGRLPMDQLNDQDLLTVYTRSALYGAGRALKASAREVVGRTGLSDKIDLAGIYGTLADLEEATAEKLQYLDKAQEAAVAQGRSPAMWLLRALPIHLTSGDSTTATDIINRIQQNHINEPGVADQFYGMLMQLGILRPDGTPAMQAPPDAAGGSGKIWTPGDPNPPAASEPDQQEPDKPGLWVPGMD